MLRQLKEKDAKAMLNCISDPSVNKYMNIDGSKMIVDDCLEFIKISLTCPTSKHFAIVDEYDNWVGTISLKNIDEVKKEAEYAIITDSNIHGKGYAYKATLELLDYAFNDLNLIRVYLNVVEDNVRANNFYHKCGFKLYKSNTYIIIKGKEYKLNWYHITKERNGDASE